MFDKKKGTRQLCLGSGRTVGAATALDRAPGGGDPFELVASNGTQDVALLCMHACRACESASDCLIFRVCGCRTHGEIDGRRLVD